MLIEKNYSNTTIMRKKIAALPLVSVVMPSLNQVQFIEAAIRSVLEQNYENIELIVADGMSTDGTIKKLIDLQKEYGCQRLRWASQKDDGPAQAINHAISQANGDVIGWLNSDDMYTQGAISRAVEHFAKRPKHQIVYGKGQHIDTMGRIISNYPTKAPSQPLDNFMNGSFICQPTVFMRRDALKEVGELDPKISAAFDFDLFIRFFKCYPRQIGLINRIQAFSRIHPECITHRLRKQIALDAMQVIFKELGTVPEHWFWTHIDEIFDAYPFESNKLLPSKQAEDFLKEAAKYYKQNIAQNILEKLKQDARLKLITNNVGIDVHPDGWLKKGAVLRYHHINENAKFILLECTTNWPINKIFRLKITTSDGDPKYFDIESRGTFLFNIEIPDSNKKGYKIWKIESSQNFVPAKFNSESKDYRKLSVNVTSLKIKS